MTPSRRKAQLATRTIQGAGIAVVLAIARVVGGGGSGFSILQIVAGCFAAAAGGAVGGAVYHASDGLRERGGLGRTLANVVSLLVYCSVTLLVLMLVFGARK